MVSEWGVYVVVMLGILDWSHSIHNQRIKLTVNYGIQKVQTLQLRSGNFCSIQLSLWTSFLAPTPRLLTEFTTPVPASDADDPIHSQLPNDNVENPAEDWEPLI